MAFSKYYTDYQAPQARQNGTAELLEKLRKMQEQQQAQNQPSASDFNNIGKLAKMGKNYFGSPEIAGTPTRATTFTSPTGVETTAYQSPAPVTDMWSGATMNPASSASTNGLTAAEPSWYSNLFDFGGGGQNAALMNPAIAIPTAAVLAANVAHNKGISPWSETAKGQLAGNTVDYYQGRKDGKQHGAMSKILDPDGATGQLTKAFTDFSTLDFGNGLKGVEDGLKSLFKLKLF